MTVRETLFDYEVTLGHLEGPVGGSWAVVVLDSHHHPLEEWREESDHLALREEVRHLLEGHRVLAPLGGHRGELVDTGLMHRVEFPHLFPDDDEPVSSLWHDPMPDPLEERFPGVLRRHLEEARLGERREVLRVANEATDPVPEPTGDGDLPPVRPTTQLGHLMVEVLDLCVVDALSVLLEGQVALALAFVRSHVYALLHTGCTPTLRINIKKVNSGGRHGDRDASAVGLVVGLEILLVRPVLDALPERLEGVVGGRVVDHDPTVARQLHRGQPLVHDLRRERVLHVGVAPHALRELRPVRDRHGPEVRMLHGDPVHLDVHHLTGEDVGRCEGDAVTHLLVELEDDLDHLELRRAVVVIDLDREPRPEGPVPDRARRLEHQTRIDGGLELPHDVVVGHPGAIRVRVPRHLEPVARVGAAVAVTDLDLDLVVDVGLVGELDLRLGDVDGELDLEVQLLDDHVAEDLERDGLGDRQVDELEDDLVAVLDPVAADDDAVLLELAPMVEGQVVVAAERPRVTVAPREGHHEVAGPDRVVADVGQVDRAEVHALVERLELDARVAVAIVPAVVPADHLLDVLDLRGGRVGRLGGVGGLGVGALLRRLVTIREDDVDVGVARLGGAGDGEEQRRGSGDQRTAAGGRCSP